jgi:hypothetical protein
MSQYAEYRLFLSLSCQHVLFPLTRSKDTTFTEQSLHIITFCKSDVFLACLADGRYILEARVTGNTGEVQTSHKQGTVPNGATEYYIVMVDVA